MIRKISLAAAAVLIAGAASAADLPSRKAPEAYAPVAMGFSWAGVYVGADVGYAWGRDVGGLNPAVGFGAPSGWRTKNDGVTGGLYAGYNRQYGALVAGIEIDAQLSGAKGSQINNLGYDIRTKSEWTGAGRVRLGYAFDRALLYVAGGVAVADQTASFAFTGAAPFGRNNAVRVGWTLGAGVDYAFTNNIIGRLEYRYADYGTRTVVDTANNYRDRSRDTSQTVLLGLAYKFGGPSAIVAKY